MKIILAVATLIYTFTLAAQKTDSLLSGVYYWKDHESKKEESGIIRRILEGKTFALD